MEYFGFKRENAGKFAYRSPDTPRERDRRQNGVKEIKRLAKDLKSARDGTFNGFEAFIRVSENAKSFIVLSGFFF